MQNLQRPNKLQLAPLSTEDDSSDTQQQDYATAMCQQMKEAVIKTSNNRFDRFETNFESLKIAEAELKSCMDTADEALSDHDNRIRGLETKQLLKKNKVLQAKVLDLEGRSRRLNITLVGILEDEEHGKPT